MKKRARVDFKSSCSAILPFCYLLLLISSVYLNTRQAQERIFNPLVQVKELPLLNRNRKELITTACEQLSSTEGAPTVTRSLVSLRVGVCKNVEPTGSGTSSDNGKGGELDTAEPEEIAQDECLVNKAEEGVVKEITPEESDLAHRSEDLEERVDTGSTMAVTEGDLRRAVRVSVQVLVL
ncbi:Uncharacterized protein Fot_56479 [Forsythia ovata]|uniref:Uncharacterized protein n=1 Tax=Forsythia ovata TaxID=205694 RepID=A0ABD1NZM4_9LAMI